MWRDAVMLSSSVFTAQAGLRAWHPMETLVSVKWPSTTRYF